MFYANASNSFRVPAFLRLCYEVPLINRQEPRSSTLN